ncbi:DUF4249 domain-containing protein [Reichenbachiella sp. MSK19-1]|uniref:DUF4249 domain-containing protein n=1 Tax=Reichenbachiella sp. MSK19-1 TaxID=1897631 RepID=UPI000E6BA126|nr:DUF4249 domain-containing protein [Reichenbachiella sp. MSK19-1]RJE75013.1 hypothetical protein BGP76_18030 [Reichenbachiella sp. MSK19-1]
MNTRVVILLLLATSGVLSISCLEEVKVDLPSGEPRRVVYGWIRHDHTNQEIKLNWSNSYASTENYEPISQVGVYVYSDRGNKYTFTEVENTGIYITDTNDFATVVGASYQLFLITDGDTLVSYSEKMQAVPSIDTSFVSFIVDPQRFVVEDEQDNYYVSALINDEPDVANYYRWKIYVNGELRNHPSEIVLFDDLFTDGNKFRVDAKNVVFKKGDSVSVEQYSLTSRAYQYLVAIKNQTDQNSIGPNAKPNQVIGNVRSISDPNSVVFGYFGVSDVTLVREIQWIN